MQTGSTYDAKQDIFNMDDSISQGLVCWITGLSGAGKSTLSEELVRRLRGGGQSFVYLDGDGLRAIFGAVSANDKNHGREGRLALALQYSRLCNMLSKQGFNVIIATISLFKEVHQWNRENISNYYEVFLDVPVEELRRRDPKGIYKKFDLGTLSNVAGLDLEIDVPKKADLTINFEPSFTVSKMADELIKQLRKRDKL